MATNGSSAICNEPEHSIQTGIGLLKVRRPKILDRAADIPTEKKVRFTSNILPKWA